MGYSPGGHKGRTRLSDSRFHFQNTLNSSSSLRAQYLLTKGQVQLVPLGWVGSQPRLLHIRVWGPGLPAGPALASCALILRGSGEPHTSDHHLGSQGQTEARGAAAQTLGELCMLWPQQGNV